MKRKTTGCGGSENKEFPLPVKIRRPFLFSFYFFSALRAVKDFTFRIEYKLGKFVHAVTCRTEQSFIS